MKKEKLDKIQKLLFNWGKETENMMRRAQADPLLRDSKQSPILKGYYEVLNEITQYANELFVSEGTLEALSVLRKLHQASNKFSDQKGQKGYPKVINVLNPYEIIFAHQYLYYTNEIFGSLLDAADEFKEEKFGKWFGFFSSLLGLEQILKHGYENSHKLKASLPQFLHSKEAGLQTIESRAFVVIEDDKQDVLISPITVCLANFSEDFNFHRIQVDVTAKEIELLSDPFLQRNDNNKLIYDGLVYKICASVNFVFPSATAQATASC
jgi:hypothetical protein